MNRISKPLGALIAALVSGVVAVPGAGADAGLTVSGRAGDSVIIRGGGWGHGMGMSQYGAYGRALNGQSAAQIVEHYYTGADVRVANMPNRVRVGLLQGRSRITATTAPFTTGGGDAEFSVAGSGVVAKGPSGTSWRVEASATGGMRLFKNGVRIKKDGVSVFGDPDHPLVMSYERFATLVSIEGKPHDYAYGKLRFGTYSTPCSDYCLRLVLKLPMQEYLFGLGEVPASWPGAALRAQAIAGRTYAFSKVRRLGQHLSPCDCAVYDSTVDQAYIGDSKRTGSGVYWDDWQAAVTDTAGQVILYGGEPIQALYSSSSGGHTENNENVWGGTPIPYLRGVNDAPDDVSGNPNHKWRVTMSWSTFSGRLKGRFGTGKVRRVTLVRPFGVSGRVTVVKSASAGGVRIVGSDKTVRADGWDVRNALGLRDSLFRIRVVSD